MVAPLLLRRLRLKVLFIILVFTFELCELPRGRDFIASGYVMPMLNKQCGTVSLKVGLLYDSIRWLSWIVNKLIVNNRFLFYFEITHLLNWFRFYFCPLISASCFQPVPSKRLCLSFGSGTLTLPFACSFCCFVVAAYLCVTPASLIKTVITDLHCECCVILAFKSALGSSHWRRPFQSSVTRPY